MIRLLKRRSTPRDPIAELLRFLPKLEAGEFQKAIKHHRKTGENLPQVEALKQALQQSGLIYGPEWHGYFLKRYKLVLAPGGIARMPPQEIQVLLTAILRTDRLAEGLLAFFCQSSLMLLILRRIKVLHENGQMTPLLR